MECILNVLALMCNNNNNCNNNVFVVNILVLIMHENKLLLHLYKYLK